VDLFKKAVYCLIFVFLPVFFSGCSENTSIPDDRITAAVSIVPQETFVKAVAGDLVDVIAMIPPGKSPENYSPTPKQMEGFSKASIYFSIGVPAEEASILPKAGELNKNIRIVHLADRVGEVYPHRFLEDGHSHGGMDPHIWLSPKRVGVMIDVIADELSVMDSKNSSLFRSNAEKYKKELEKADLEIRSLLGGLEKRTFIIYHPAYGYFADDYGLNMLSLEEDGKEATIQDFKDLIDVAKQEGIKVVFYQAETDSRQAEAFARELGGKAVMLDPLSPDYIGNLKKTAQIFKEVLEQPEYE